MTDAMPIKAIAPWYGAKRKAALREAVTRHIGSPAVLVDPACGSCAVPLDVCGRSCPPNTVIVNDLHGELYNLALVLADFDMACGLLSCVERQLFSEDLFRSYVGVLERAGATIPDVQRAAAYLYVSWTGHNGFAGTTAKPRFNVRFTSGGGDPARRLRSVCESIPEWHERMRSWTILNRDMFDVLDSVPDREDTTIYCDPPYHHDARSAARYVHDFADDVGGSELFDRVEAPKHVRLEARLSEFRMARVVVSHYDCPAIRGCYPEDRWEWHENPVKKSIANASGVASDAPEVVLVRRTP